MTIEGNCKINLSLDVTGILKSGYHSIRTVFQELSLSDKISMEFGKSGVCLSSDSEFIPTDSRNIAYRGAELFYEATKIEDGVHIHIEKHIPVQAGLAGGSTDGAAVLKGMNEHYGNPLSMDELMCLGAKLGADVPFCIMGGTCLAEGIGEILTPIESKIQGYVLIVKPPCGVSTPWAYKRLDQVGYTDKNTNTEGVVSAMEDGDIHKLCECMGNVFEKVVAEEIPEILIIKEDMMKYGALGSMMSGSGPSVFGIFLSEEQMNTAYDYFKSRYKDTYKTKMK